MNSMRRRSSLRLVTNPPNPWRATRVEWEDAEIPRVSTTVYEDRTRSILSRNDSPDLDFTWSVNPYRGCYHGCAYCYARPSHEYLDFGAGTDFEQQLVVKPDAPALLEQAFGRRSWRGEQVVFSGNTDCYQPLEATWELTRQCLQVCLRHRQPVGVITKSTLIERDAELLAALTEEAYCAVGISIPFHDPARARAVEPHVPTPRRRYETIRRLTAAGLAVSVNIAPIIPGLNDEDVPKILEHARAAGAVHAGHGMVRLPGPVEGVFVRRLREALPDRADRVMRQIEACRAGARDDARFGLRMRGRGPRWQAITDLFERTAARLGFGERPPVPDPSPFRRPRDERQLSLW